MTACAYCGDGQKAMTREHIWPRCILERTKHDLRYSGKARKLVRSDLVVKDVCGDCNNEVLSSLDNYFCSLYDSYFAHEVHEGQPVVFRYDYGMLVRSLLKIAYNSSRTTGIDEEGLRAFAPIIGARDSVPLGIFIKVATIMSSTLRHTPGVKKLPAVAARCGPIEILGRKKEGFSAKIVQLNGYRFYLIMTDDITNRAAAVKYLVNESGTWIRANVARTYRALQGDPAIKTFGLTPYSTAALTEPPLFIIPQQEFPKAIQNLAVPLEIFEKTRVREEPARLIILKAWLNHAKRKWSFEWNGVPISAPIKDEKFLNEIENREHLFGTGDALDVVLSFKQNFDEAIGVYKNDQNPYTVKEVIKPVPRAVQTKL